MTMGMAEIERLWADILSQPFPDGYTCERVSADLNVDLAELDTFAAGCIVAFISSQGRLDAERISVLRRCVEELKILKGLTDENDPKQKGYVIQLLVISEKVLESSK